MYIIIEADRIDDILAKDECLVPVVEDLLLDALIEYRDTPTRIYAPQAQVTTQDGLNIEITIQSYLPQFIRGSSDPLNGNGKHKEVHNEHQNEQDTDHRDD